MAEGGGATSSKPKDYTEEKAGKTKISKKNHRKLLVAKQKMGKTLIVIPGHQKWLQSLAAD